MGAVRRAAHAGDALVRLPGQRAHRHKDVSGARTLAGAASRRRCPCLRAGRRASTLWPHAPHEQALVGCADEEAVVLRRHGKRPHLRPRADERLEARPHGHVPHLDERVLAARDEQQAVAGRATERHKRDPGNLVAVALVAAHAGLREQVPDDDARVARARSE